MSVSNRVSDNGNFVLITIKNRLDLHDHHDFRNCYRNEKPDAMYEIDLSEADYIDSSALGMLLLLREFAGGTEANITISGCNDKIKKIMAYTNFEEIFRFK